MSDLSRMTLPVDAASVVVIGTGGEARTRKEYRGGEATGAMIQRDGADVHRLTGVAVSIGGVGLDGASVETTTGLESVGAGTVFKAEGVVEVSVRADAKPGFGDRGPRGVLVPSVYVQRLVPAGSITELLAKDPVKKPAGHSDRASA